MNLEAIHSTRPSSLPLQLEQIHLSAERAIFVVRDDLLPAGTKQRAIIPLLTDFKRQGATHMIYASPFAGFAQVALAYGCHSLDLRCTLFCEKDPHQPGASPHPFTQLAESWGAEIILTDSLGAAEEKAEAFARKSGGRKIPLGFHCREFQRHFQTAVNSALGEIKVSLGFLPKRAWLPVGSGTLTNAFHKVAPESMELCCVDVHVLHPNDLRLQALRLLPRVKYFSAAEAFAERAAKRPPMPSNIHYDAKLWAFVKDHAENGDLWWNVAR